MLIILLISTLKKAIRMKYLYRVSVENLEKLIENKLRIKNWKVYDLPASERINEIETWSFFNILKERAKAKEINARPAEILSWLDTLNLLYYSLQFVNERVRDELTIIQEYQIPFTNKRADYVLVYQNKILIVEFSFDRLGDTYKYETKLTQAIGYKELLTNVLPSYIEIGTYTFLINPEVDANGEELLKWNKFTQEEDLANNERIQEFGYYINRFFSKETYVALSQLDFLDGYIAGMEASEIDEKVLNDTDDDF